MFPLWSGSISRSAYQVCILLSVLCCVLSACSDASLRQLPDNGNIVAGGLPSLDLLSRHSSAAAGGRVARADWYEAGLASSRVSLDDTQLVFSPAGSAVLGGGAYAIFQLSLAPDLSPAQLHLSWNGTAPAAEDLVLGLANWDSGRWELYSASDSSLPELPALDPYLDDTDGRLFLLVMLRGSTPASLQWLRFGDNAPPVIQISIASALPARAPQEVTLDASASVDVDGSIEDYSFDWYGSGLKVDAGAAVSASFTYMMGGQYSPVVTLTDNEGASSSWSPDSPLEVMEHSPWWRTGGNLRNTRRGEANGPSAQPADTSWFYSFTHQLLRSLAIGNDGTIYVTESTDVLYAINPQDGSQLWTYEPAPYLSFPRVGPGGRVFIGFYKEEDSETYLRCINPDKSFVWDYHDPDNKGFRGFTILGEPLVFSGSNELIALNPEDGSVAWNTPVGYPICSDASVDNQGNIYVLAKEQFTSSANLVSFTADGEFRWEYQGGESINPPMVGDDGRIYFVGGNRRAYCVNPDGSEGWVLLMDYDPIEDGPFALGKYVSQDQMYFPAEDKYLRAVLDDGTLGWSFRSLDLLYEPEYPLVGADGNIFFGHKQGWIFCIKPNKNEKWSLQNHFETGTDRSMPAAIGADGTLYVIHDEPYRLLAYN